VPLAGVLAAGVLAAGVLVAAKPGPLGPRSCSMAAGATELFRFRDPRIDESSGLAVSSYADDVFFTHNDSGDRRGRFFAVDARGRTLADIRPDVRTTDVEDIARRGRELWLADIGDNRHQRDQVQLFRVPEPRLTGPVGTIEVSARVYRLRYPDGRHDAESLLVHPGTGRAYVATKSLFGSSALYAAPPRLDPDRVSVLTKVAHVPLLPTGGAFSPRGDRFVLRSYRYALVWRVDGDDVAAALRRPPLRVALPAQRQGEGVTVIRDGTRLAVSSEGVRAPVYAVPLPAPSPTGGAPTHVGRETAERARPRWGPARSMTARWSRRRAARGARRGERRRRRPATPRTRRYAPSPPAMTSVARGSPEPPASITFDCSPRVICTLRGCACAASGIVIRSTPLS
jgi:hypothetical protein